MAFSRPLRPTLDLVATWLTVATCVLVASLTVWDRVRATQTPPPRSRPSQIPLPVEPVSLQGVAIRGNTNAEVILLEYSDFECPYCAKFAREVQPELNRLYVASGRVGLAFRHTPLPVHSHARKAAEAAECAGRQGQFWEMHDALFRQRQDLSVPNLIRQAATLQLDGESFEQCLGGDMADKVSSDLASAKKLFVSGTPTFFLGLQETPGTLRLTQRLDGAATLEEFRKLIDRTLGAPKPGS